MPGGRYIRLIRYLGGRPLESAKAQKRIGGQCQVSLDYGANRARKGIDWPLDHLQLLATICPAQGRDAWMTMSDSPPCHAHYRREVSAWNLGAAGRPQAAGRRRLLQEYLAYCGEV